MKNRLKRQRNEELRKLYFGLIDPKREGGKHTKNEAFEKVMEVARNKYFLTSEITVRRIIFKYGFYKQPEQETYAAVAPEENVKLV
ncbi:MAG: hypothetical protein L0Y80_00935 [Ignavibacteriae bacterium]|nr:hypothetical protein [Ignavibacteriota bacterium]